MRFTRILNNKLIAITILLVFHISYRVFLLAVDAFPFNSDEAIVGLMGKHILDGENFLFFYGQSYMGSIDAYLVAFAFLLIGEQVVAIRLVQIFLFAIGIIFVYLFICENFEDEKIAFLGSMFFVFSPVNVILYTTVSLGGYAEALLLGIVCFYLSVDISKKISNGKISVRLLFLGFLIGAGLFINPLSLTIMIPGLLFLIYKERRILLTKLAIGTLIPVFISGFLIGSSPFWYSLFFSNGMTTLSEITGSAVAVENATYFGQIIQHLRSFILFGPSVIFGIRAPWSIEWIGKLLIPIVLFFWILLIYLFIRNKYPKEDKEKLVALLLIVLFTIAGFIFTSFGVDPTGRYFLPLIFPLSVMFGYGVVKFNNKIIFALAIVIILYQVYGTISLSFRKPYLTTQFYGPAQVDHSNITALVDFLKGKNELYGFTNYWVAYPLAFLSDEDIISIPKLPYHNDLRYTERDNRIDKYNSKIEGAPNYFYITTNNDPLDDLIIEKLEQKQISFQIKSIDDYKIYYNLSQKITPDELGITDEYK